MYHENFKYNGYHPGNGPLRLPSGNWKNGEKDAG
jgi:hypothetical protein